MCQPKPVPTYLTIRPLLSVPRPPSHPMTSNLLLRIHYSNGFPHWRSLDFQHRCLDCRSSVPIQNLPTPLPSNSASRPFLTFFLQKNYSLYAWEISYSISVIRMSNFAISFFCYMASLRILPAKPFGATPICLLMVLGRFSSSTANPLRNWLVLRPQISPTETLWG